MVLGCKVLAGWCHMPACSPPPNSTCTLSHRLGMIARGGKRGSRARNAHHPIPCIRQELAAMLAEAAVEHEGPTLPAQRQTNYQEEYQYCGPPTSQYVAIHYQVCHACVLQQCPAALHVHQDMSCAVFCTLTWHAAWIRTSRYYALLHSNSMLLVALCSRSSLCFAQQLCNCIQAWPASHEDSGWVCKCAA